MPDRRTEKPHVVDLAQAAEVLNLPPAAVEALVEAGYLAPSSTGPNATVPLVDLKAFIARNADNGSGNLVFSEAGSVDPSELLEALDGKAEDMAKRAFGIFSGVFPETASWAPSERARFVEQAKNRFEAILAVTSQGSEVDEAIVGDLQEIGANAAWTGAPLPQLLVILRISRDLVVQTAVELAEERGRHWSLALSLLLTRILPAMDRLTDAIAQGYWAAMVRRENEQKTRYEHVVEHSSDGVYEIDLDGRIQYANPSMALIVARPMEEVLGARLGDLLTPLDAQSSLEPLTNESPGGSRLLELTVARRDGVRRVLEVRTLVRRRDGEVAGFQGIVRDVTSAHDLEADKNEFLALMTYELRQPLTAVLGLGATIQANAEKLSLDRIKQMGATVRLQAERMARLADDLYDISRLEAKQLLVSPQPVDLAQTVHAALATVTDGALVEVEVPAGLTVLADARRLEQVVVNLVENALAYGAPPVQVLVAGVDKVGVEVAVIDHGPGVPSEIVPSLFNRLRLLARRGRERTGGTGLGLSLVNGLVQAMGGRVWYEQVPGGGADFRILLPVPREAKAS